VVDASSIVHSSAAVYQSHKIFYSRNIFNSNDIWFSTDLIWCNECLYCDWLENQSYCIGNEQLSKEDYFKKKEHILGEKDKFESRKQTHKPWNLGSKNCTGASIVKSEDVVNGAFLYQVNRSRNVTFSGSKNGNYELFDVHHFWSPSWNTAYAVCGGWSGVEHLYCSTHVNGGSNIYYSIYLENCSFCLWCIGLRNQEYCIFNKQYTKDEWYEKVDEIFTQMEEDWVLGNFFPWSMNRFYFNDTAACLIDPSFTKEEVTALWYLWRDEPIKVDIPDWMETVKTSELWQYEWCNDGIRTIDPVILKKVIIDEQGNNYRIVKLEYDFLMKHGLPLPRKHWLERMKENFTI
jgi:hypothetical protein